MLVPLATDKAWIVISSVRISEFIVKPTHSYGSLPMHANLHLGLRKMIQPGETAPALFSDPLFLRSSYWVISTSAIHHPNFEVYGWGEVVPDGFGVAYVAGQDGALLHSILI
jgi:hypothetical protein